MTSIIGSFCHAIVIGRGLKNRLWHFSMN